MQKQKNKAEPSLASPCSRSEQALESYVDFDTACSENVKVLEAPGNCDLCNVPFEERKFWIDAKLKNRLLWGNMCSDCFLRRGEGIAWGKGQLFARMLSSEWLMVAGFTPEGRQTDTEAFEC